MLKILFIILFISNCNPVLNKSYLPYLGLLISEKVQASTPSTTIPNVVSFTPKTKDPTKALPIISSLQKLSIQFDKDMDQTACNSVTQNSVSINGVTTTWTDTKTVEVSPPSSGWNLGLTQEQKLSISNCKDPSGNTATNVSNGYLIAETLIHMSVSGNDSNSGTRDAPKATLAGSLLAVSSCAVSCAVLTSAGNYSISSDAILPAKVSLFGGNTTDWSDRDIVSEDSSYRTNIADARVLAGNTIGNQIRILSFTGSGYNAETSIVEGYTFQNASTAVPIPSFASAIYINSATATGLTIRFNKFLGGINATSGTTYAIYSTSTTGVNIFGNYFSGGNDAGAREVISISINNTTLISNNIIQGGTANSYNGIRTLNATSTLIQNNFISGGTAVNDSAGIQSQSEDIIQSNSIEGPTVNGAESSGVLLNGTTSVIVQSNASIKGGPCTGVSCRTIGIDNSTSKINISITKNALISGGVCSSTSCNSNGIYSGSSVTSGFLIEENTISGGSTASNGSGVRLDAGSYSFLSIKNNLINGGVSSTGGDVSAIAINPGTNFNQIQIEGNTLNGGSNTAAARGITMEPSSSSGILIYRNTILAGQGSSPQGIYLSIGTQTASIVSNVISKPLTGTHSSSYGVFYAGCSTGAGNSFLLGNTIYLSSTSSTSTSVINLNAAACRPEIRYNIISAITGTTKYCLQNAVVVTQDPHSLIKNTFHSCTGNYINRTGTIYNNFCSGDFGISGLCVTLFSVLLTTSANNIDTPIYTNVSSFDFTLDPSTPASIRTGLTSANITEFGTLNLDRNGNLRTDGSALGAFR
ncbi:MAG: hypothetical protein SFU98_07905 [Leptospiraceae bacterium]|nr:hypothetical protein [Leptospiraceae bacterium]